MLPALLLALRRSRFLHGVLADHLDVRHLIALGHTFKDKRQFPVCQDLHMVFRGRRVFCKNFYDGPGRDARILRDFVYSVFFNSQ